MIHYSEPPVLLRDVIPDLADVRALLERNAPYTPLGGWYAPGADLDAETSTLWFQNDWVHAGLQVEGSERFLFNERVMQAARDFYDAMVIRPHSVYVNLMAAIERHGPAHTDNPRFQGRDRSNTPMWLLRVMFWSDLFDDRGIVQATSIWWMNDVEEGAFRYWPDGPDKPYQEHHGDMANTSLVGDNHGMFHQVGPVGPFDRGTIRVTPRAELAPAEDGRGDWVVMDRGVERYRAPLSDYRVSVLWKADVYPDEAERERQIANPLSMADVVEVFNRDLEARGETLRLSEDRIEEPEVVLQMQEIYPEARPLGAAPSFYEVA